MILKKKTQLYPSNKIGNFKFFHVASSQISQEHFTANTATEIRSRVKLAQTRVIEMGTCISQHALNSKEYVNNTVCSSLEILVLSV